MIIKRKRFFRTMLGGVIPIILALLIAGVSGCKSVSQQFAWSDGEDGLVFASQNLVKEECRVQRSVNPKTTDFKGRQFEIYCGRWEHASGYIFELTSFTAPKALSDWSNQGWWREWLDRKVLCENGVPNLIFGDVDALILPCKLRNGDWPYLALVVEVDGSIYLADGIPAILPVLEDGIGFVSGRIDGQAAVVEKTHSAALQRVKNTLKGSVIYGAGDIRTYYRLMAAGQFYNSIKDFTTAAHRYREAITLHERVFGADNPGILDPMMHLALEMSNQGRFAEADLLFNRVGIFVRNSLDGNDRARYLSYRALHAANKREFDAALNFAERATVLRKELAEQGVNSQGGRGYRDDAVINAGEGTPAVDIVQSLYIEASMLERLGRLSEAEETLREINGILQGADEIPASWEPELLGLTARIAKARGADAERGRHLSTALSIWEQVAPGERPSVINFLKLGEAYRRQSRIDDAMAAFRKAIKLVKSRNGSLDFDQLLPFFRTGLELADSRTDRRDEIYAEMFEAGQLIRSEQTTRKIKQAVVRMAATEAKGTKGAAGNVVREFQEAQDERFFYNPHTRLKSPNLKTRIERNSSRFLRLKLPI